MLLTLALALSGPAHAADLTITKAGLTPAFVFVDGKSKGKLTKKEPLVVSLDAGAHEVWVSLDEGGVYTRCFGTLTVGARASLQVTDTGCPGLKEGRGERTAARGGMVALRGPLDLWVTVDGATSFVVPTQGLWLNVTPGWHTVILARDPGMDGVFCQGRVNVGQRDTVPLTWSNAGCVGFVKE